MKFSKKQREQLEASNAAAWALFNNFKTEDGRKFELYDRKYLTDVLADNSKSIAIKKSAQVGFSSAFIIKAFHLARFQHINLAYTLPTKAIVNDFVKPKVNPIILQNPAIQQTIKEDSQTLKKVHENFIYFRGSWGEREGITISLDGILADEYDRSEQSVLEIYSSRLKASRHRYFWRFSNPSIPSGGVDYFWNQSDKKEWFMECKRCGHRSFATFEQQKRYKTHFVNVDKSVLICGKCGKPLTDDDRRDGEWVAEYPKKKISGYHLSHLMCAWIPISDIIEDSLKSPSYFHNFVLGEPYVTKDIVIDRETIVQCLAPNKPKDVAQYFLGVDTKAGPKHWVLGCIQTNGQKWVRGYGMTQSWDDIERIINQYNAVAVIDANPYPQYPRKLTKKYPGRVFMHWFKEDTKNVGVIRWGRSSPSAPEETHKVFSDRTMIIDDFVYALNNKEIFYTMSLAQIEDYIGHLTVMYRALIEKPTEPGTKAVEKPEWVTPASRPNDWAFASFYCYVAMHRSVIQTGRSVRFQTKEKEKPSGWHVQDDGQIKRPYHTMKEHTAKHRKRKSWMYR